MAERESLAVDVLSTYNIANMIGNTEIGVHRGRTVIRSLFVDRSTSASEQY